MPVGAFTPNTAAPMGVAAPGESPLQPEGPNSSLPGLLQSPNTKGKSAGEGRAGSKLGVKKKPPRRSGSAAPSHPGPGHIPVLSTACSGALPAL